ncbi:hypothetical protein IJE86_01340 [bacterium]|nr:hypothetical protein [bacterium]
MLRGKGTNIIMTEGDFGLNLPITIKGESFEPTDTIKVRISQNDEEILTKTFTNIENNTFKFALTKEESELLTPNYYVYSLDWYRGDTFLCNIIRNGLFEVEDKH